MISGEVAVATGATAEVRPGTGPGIEAPKVHMATILLAAGAPVAWSSPLPWVQMLSDLVTASGARQAGDADGILTATAESSTEAIVLGVRALRLTLAYRRHAGGEPQGFAVGIVGTSEKGASAENAVRAALKSEGFQGRVLVAGATLAQLRTMPGVQSRKVAVPGGQRAEIHELVPAESERVEEVATPVLAEVSLAAKTELRMPAQSAKESEYDEPVRAGKTKLVMGSLAAALVVGAGIYALLGRSHPAAAAAPTPVGAIAQPVPSNVAPTVSIPAAAVPVVTPEKKPDPVTRAAKNTGAPAKAAGKTPVEAGPAAKPQESEQPTKSGFTGEQLRSILDKADKLTANGKYEEAIRNYSIVLASEPANGRAKAGKERAITNRNLQ